MRLLRSAAAPGGPERLAELERGLLAGTLRYGGAERRRVHREELPANRTDQVTVQIAQGLGKATTAEFVGDPATVDPLRDYHVGRPRPVEPRPGFLA